MTESRSFKNSTSSRVKNQLETIEVRARKVDRVAVVYLIGMNERCRYGFSCSRIESISDSTKSSNQK